MNLNVNTYQPRRARRFWLSSVLLFATLLVALVTPVAAQNLGNSPAIMVPQDRWRGEIQPLAIAGDTTWFVFNYEPGCDEPWWWDVEVDGDWVFTATSQAVQIWNKSNPGFGPTPPIKTAPDAELCKPELDGWALTDADIFIRHIELPVGDRDLIGIGSGEGMGMVIADVENPLAPREIYQDRATVRVQGMVSVQYAGKDYLLVMSSNGPIAIYDLDAARALRDSGGTCIEGKTFPNCGVYVGVLSDQAGTPIKGRAIDGSGRYVVTSFFGERAVVWNVEQALTSGGVGAVKIKEESGNGVGVAMWSRGSKVYYAALEGDSVGVKSFSTSCVDATCSVSSLPSLPATTYFLGNGQPTTPNTLTFSRDGSKDYLFIGTSSRSGVGQQHEFLYDVTTPTVVDEVRAWPANDDDELGYWGWYYLENGLENNSSEYGFRNFAPIRAVVNGGVLYRAGLAIFDTHKIGVEAAPGANFSLNDATVFGGDTVELQDDSSGNPTSWSWRIKRAGQIVAGPFTQPDVSWNVPDNTGFPVTYTVELEACNQFGCTVAGPKNLQVLDPVPHSGSVTAAPLTVSQCSEVTFTAKDVLGRDAPQDPLHYNWDVLRGGASQSPSAPDGAVFKWAVPSNQTPGTNYFGRVEVSNSYGSTTLDSPLVTVVALPDLTDPVLSGFSETLGFVTYDVQAQGATTWTWQWDYLNNPNQADVFTDPTQGPSQTHQYDAPGTYIVRVTVDDCRSNTPPRFVEAEITVNEVETLEITQFRADACTVSIFCSADVNKPISFSVSTVGPTAGWTWSYDWEGNGTFVAGSAPVGGKVSNTYTTVGNKSPKVRATRSGQSITRAHTPTVISIEAGGNSGPDPSVTVSGARSALVGQIKTYTASAQNCVPATNWTWAVSSGGTIQGAATGSSIQVQWTSAGSFSVRATAGGTDCESANAAVAVRVTEEQDPGNGNEPDNTGGIKPSINRDVTAPAVGQAVEFDASGSSGDIVDYYWDFGDGTKLGPGDFPTVSHTYKTAGTYKVLVELSRPDASCTFRTCVAQETFNVTVAATSGPCQPSNTTMCLQGGRFQVEVDWEAHEGTKGQGQVVSGLGTTESGLFYFFTKNNWEMLVKVLDGCANNDKFWVFAASTTDVGFDLTVTDLVTSEEVTYNNKVGVSAPAITDTSALSSCSSP
jgi:hypothetical protein